MNITHYLVPLFISLGLSAPASAQYVECSKKVGKQDICQFATQLAGILSEQLPTQSGQVTLEKATASRNVVYVSGRLEFDQTSANNFFAEKNLTLRQFEETYSRQMAPKLCGRGSPTHAFIEAGGAILYSYAYKDGKPFMRFGVRSCQGAS